MRFTRFVCDACGEEVDQRAYKGGWFGLLIMNELIEMHRSPNVPDATLACSLSCAFDIIKRNER